VNVHAAARTSYMTARAMASQLRPRRADRPGVRILGYHRISQDHDHLAITPAQLRRQMLSLLDRGMSPVALDQAGIDVDGEDGEDGEAGHRRFCVTFDDGYLDTVDTAIPILQELGVVATVFVVTEFLDATASFGWYARPPAAMDWRDARALLDAGMAIGSHTRTHRWLPTLDPTEAWREIHGSRVELEDRLGIPVPWLCYPAGRYGPREAEMAEQAGYSGALTTRRGMSSSTSPRFELRRYMVEANMNRLWFTALTAGSMDADDVVTRRVRSWARRTATPAADHEQGQ
jgi:peptidoglycan/xylan/chitin deacetylase (PgdA/CDA1 family)